MHPLGSGPDVKHMGNKQTSDRQPPKGDITEGLGAVASLIWGELAGFSSS